MAKRKSSATIAAPHRGTKLPPPPGRPPTTFSPLPFSRSLNVTDLPAALRSASTQSGLGNTTAIASLLFYGDQEHFPSIRALTVLVTAALLANQADTLPDSFAQANDVTLNVFCNVASSASNISSATGQAVLSAIPKFFGDQPCEFSKPMVTCCMTTQSQHAESLTQMYQCTTAAKQRLNCKGTTPSV
ncbi:hypothetical protein WJX82_006758 [Trebouxia sp. C0006]